jgi:ATP-dependent protease ClpP protease subunit
MNNHRLLFTLLIIAIPFALFFGCAGAPVPTTSQPIDLNITVESVTDSVITVEEDRPYTIDERKGLGLGQLSPLTWINDDQTKAFIAIFSGLSVSDVKRLWNDIMWLEENTGILEVDLFINSGGGDAFSGLALADQIIRARDRGFVIHAHASGIIASAAVPVFTACSTRSAAPGTIFMVHEAALWKWPGRETASDIEAQNELMKILRAQYLGIMVKYSTTSFKEWREMERKTSWFDTEKAVKLGICDTIE